MFGAGVCWLRAVTLLDGLDARASAAIDHRSRATPSDPPGRAAAPAEIRADTLRGLSDDLTAIRSRSDGVPAEGDVVTNLATVQSIYEAFGKGDVPAILNVLADDVEWESWADNSAVNAGVPWMVPRRGKAEVVKFFEAAGQMDIVDLKVLDIMESGNQVAVEFVLEANLRPGAEATTATKRCTCGPSTTRARSHAFVTTPTRQSTSPPTSNSRLGCQAAFP